MAEREAPTVAPGSNSTSNYTPDNPNDLNEDEAEGFFAPRGPRQLLVEI